MSQPSPSDFEFTIGLLAYNNPNEILAVNVFQKIQVQRIFQSGYITDGLNKGRDLKNIKDFPVK